MSLVSGQGTTMDKSEREPVLVDFALQGGGSHGAFTWGVLDRLIEEPWLRIEAVSGTSAGAMNAAVVADGWTQGGAEGARAALDSYWRRVSQAAAFSPLQRSPLDRLMGRWTLDTSPAYVAMDLMARVVSPYDLNPLGLNPLRSILDQSIDFDRLARAPIKLFVTATNVRTGRGRIFRNREITADVLLASACLPTMFHAVEIDGESYWDGGYSTNPPLLSLAQESETADLLVVQVTPSRDHYVPITMAAIDRRLDQIVANAALNAELAALEWAGAASASRRTLQIHRIAAEDHVEGLAQRNAADLGHGFVALLHRSGRSAAHRWLKQTADRTSAPHASRQRLLALAAV